MSNMIRKLFASEIKEAVGDRTLEFTITAENRARDGEVVKADGGQFENYNKNPVVLWAHDYQSLPVGKTVKLERKGASIVSTVQFPTVEEYAYADTVYKLCKGGYLNAVSIGFIPIDVQQGKSEKEPSRTFTKWEMLEYSIVPVPSNPDALRNAVTAGLITIKEFQAVTKAVDYNSELNRSQLQGAVWTMLDTFGMCVIKTCGDKQDKDKSTTLTGHGDAFYACYGKWIKDAKKAGLFDEQSGADDMIMSFRDYFIKGIKPADKPKQVTIADEIDYLISLSKEAGLSDENKLTLKRLAGDDTPVQIDKAPEGEPKESLREYLRDEIKRQITEVL